MARFSHMIGIMAGNFINQLILRANKQRSVDEGGFLFHQGDTVASFFVVGEGLVELTRHQQDGGSIVLQRASRNTVLAEASTYSSHYHCDAIAKLHSTIYELSKPAFLSHLREDVDFATLWATHLAQEVQSARYRSEILSRNTVSARLNGWLSWHGEELPKKGQWKSIAVQIGVSPEALYRELARRRSA